MTYIFQNINGEGNNFKQISQNSTITKKRANKILQQYGVYLKTNNNAKVPAFEQKS